MSRPLSEQGIQTLIEFARAQDALNPVINSRAKLEAEIKRVLIYSVAFQSQVLSGGATDSMLIQQRAMERFYNDPVFHAFINSQCMELMQVLSRVEPNVL